MSGLVSGGSTPPATPAASRVCVSALKLLAHSAWGVARLVYAPLSFVCALKLSRLLRVEDKYFFVHFFPLVFFVASKLA